MTLSANQLDKRVTEVMKQSGLDLGGPEIDFSYSGLSQIISGNVRGWSHSIRNKQE